MQGDNFVPGAGIAYRESLLSDRRSLEERRKQHRKDHALTLIAGCSKYAPGRIAAKSPLAALMLAAALCAGCDPVVDIAGADFPAWLICAIAGVALAAVIRTLLVAIRIEPHLGPLTIVYPCLALLLSCVVWIIFFNRI